MCVGEVKRACVRVCVCVCMCVCVDITPLLSLTRCMARARVLCGHMCAVCRVPCVHSEDIRAIAYYLASWVATCRCFLHK